MDHATAINKGVELLKLCQYLQNNEDSIQRVDIGVSDKSKTLDQFAMDVTQSISLMTSLHQLIPMRARLAELGVSLERQGKIKPLVGEDYAMYALDFLIKEYSS